MASPLLGFYLVERGDGRGRSLAAIQGWDDAALEAVHDYIQWLFPLPEASGFNPAAPRLTPADIAAFQASPELRAALLGSFRRMLSFYGFMLDEAGPRIHAAANFAERAANWLCPGNHNLLRLTRILRCLALLGLAEHAAALLAELERVASAAGPVTLGYWRRAALSGDGR